MYFRAGQYKQAKPLPSPPGWPPGSLSREAWNSGGEENYNEFTAIGLLVDVGKAGQGVEELHDALLLPERGILLECLLDHLPELLGLGEMAGVSRLLQALIPSPGISLLRACLRR